MSNAGILSEIAWAPSGSYLLVRSDEVDRRARILELDVATGDVRSSIANAINPALSPDGTRMAFARPKGEDPDTIDIVVANADGSHRRSVIDTAGEDWGPYWSPDGRWISFTSTLHGGDPDVYVARADGSELHNLTPDSLAADQAFGWGPEGHILFLSDRSGTGGTFLYFMNPDGSDVRLALIL
jgi:Tol biopolymer transport system component